MKNLNWMQEYAATELVELSDSGMMDRREALAWLGKIFGSGAAGAAFLAACSSGDSAARPSKALSTTTSSSAQAVPPVEGELSHALSVAADDPDVRAEAVTLPGPASEIFGYLAVPVERGRYPAVIVIHEIFGLNDHIRDVARRLAKVGFVAIAPDLASRAGGTNATDNIVGALTGGPVENLVTDLDAVANYLEDLPESNGKLGVIGFCFGGAMTLSFAAAQPKVAAGVSYYGTTPQPPSVMSGTEAAILAHYGADDARVNAGIADLEAALAGKTFKSHVWEGVGHQFNNDTSPAYNETVAIDAWTETVAWLNRSLR